MKNKFLKATQAFVFVLFAFLTVHAEAVDDISFRMEYSIRYKKIAQGEGDINELYSTIPEMPDLAPPNRILPFVIAKAPAQLVEQYVKEVINMGADVNKGNGNNETPLQLAIEKGYPNVTKILIAKGADINAKGSGGKPLLCSAAGAGDKEMVELLISKGADVNAAYMEKKIEITPLTCAGRGNHADIGKLLLDKGAKITNATIVECSVKDSADFMSLLISRGIDVKMKLGGGYSMLHLAVLGSGKTSKLLLDKGADVNAKNDDGTTPLHMATEANNRVTARQLLDRGADVNAQDNNGMTPLHTAAANPKSARVAKLLLDKGANPQIKDKKGMTPKDIATAKQNRGALLLLGGEVDEKFTDEDGNTMLHIAAKIDCADAVKKLLAKGVDANAKNKKGWTPLHIAASNDSMNAAKVLLENGARLFVKTTNEKANALHIAVATNSVEVVKLLLAKGAKPNIKDSQELTALVYAVELNLPEMTKLLVDAGANTHVNFNGQSLMRRAIKARHYEVATALLGDRKFLADSLYELDNIFGGEETIGDLTFLKLLVSQMLMLPKYDSIAVCLANMMVSASKTGNIAAAKILSDAFNGKYLMVKEKVLLLALKEAIVQEQVAMAKWLLDSGAPVNVPVDGLYMLHYAVKAKNDVAFVKMLLAKGAKVDVRADHNAQAQDGSYVNSYQKPADITKNDEVIELLESAE